MNNSIRLDRSSAHWFRDDKNVYVEPAIWTIEWARNFYDYPVHAESSEPLR